MQASKKYWQVEDCKKLCGWWETLKSNRGERAHLRRCGYINSIFINPSYAKLVHSLNPEIYRDATALAVIAGLLAHVEKHVKPTNKDNPKKKSVAIQMATKKNGSAIVSEARFRRLMRCKTSEELFSFMRRAIKLLNGQLNIYDLAKTVYLWDDKEKRRWVYDYYSEL